MIEACQKCEGTGLVCEDCHQSHMNCECESDPQEGACWVDCLICEGTGEVDE